MICTVSSPVWAGGAAEQPPTNGVIQGPEVWATVIVDCVNNTAYIRAKRIVECVVEKQAFMYEGGIIDLCLADMDESSPLYQQYEPDSLFGIDGAPIVTKVKNFEHDVELKDDQTTIEFELYSFDAQLKFFKTGIPSLEIRNFARYGEDDEDQLSIEPDEVLKELEKEAATGNEADLQSSFKKILYLPSLSLLS